MRLSAFEISVLIAASAACVVFVSYYFRKARERRALLSKRPTLDLSTIYRENFSGNEIDEESFVTLWKGIADILEVPAGKLLPTDRFDVELAPPKGYEFNDPINDIRNKIARSSASAGIDPKNVISMRDYVVAFASRANASD